MSKYWLGKKHTQEYKDINIDVKSLVNKLEGGD